MIYFSSLQKNKLLLRENVSVTDRIGSVAGDSRILGPMTDRKIGGFGKGENTNSNLMNSCCTSESFQKYRMTYLGHRLLKKMYLQREPPISPATSVELIEPLLYLPIPAAGTSVEPTADSFQAGGPTGWCG